MSGGVYGVGKSHRALLLGRLVLLLLVLALLLLPACQAGGVGGILGQEASSYRFSLVRWEIQNLPAKLVESLLGLESIPPSEERGAVLDRFFELGAELDRLEGVLAQEVALHGAQGAEVTYIEDQMKVARKDYEALAPKVEAIIEHEIERELGDEGLGFHFISWNIIFPPVLFVFERLPKMLIVSPRERVERLDDMLLSPNMTIAEIETLEDCILQKHNLSAIVESLGGYSTYPSMVMERMSLYGSVATAAHEWIHAYLFFYPLGQAYNKGGVMSELNETVADMVGNKIAHSISRTYNLEPPPPQPSAESEKTFDFAAEMRETRVTLDRILAEGRVEEAERYLEERRQVFIDNGYYIRKLNQAYFAFHGTYALSPTSVSPVARQLEELHTYLPNLGEFLAAVRRASTYDKFLAVLAEKRAQHSKLEGGLWLKPQVTEAATLIG